MTKHRIFLIISTIVGILVLFVIIEFGYIMFNGKNVAAPNIPRKTTIGKGSEIIFTVMGDSTSIGQGTDYKHSYAMAAAQHLAKNNQVHLINVGVSGARANDVATKQLPQALQFIPDVVLIAVGANDVTHLTNPEKFTNSLQTTIDGLRKANPEIKIVVTGAPDMGAVPRFPWPVKGIMHSRTEKINQAYAKLVTKNGLVLAPIAKETGPIFAKHPEYFAQDKFHPNQQGYAQWIPVINKALDQ